MVEAALQGHPAFIKEWSLSPWGWGWKFGMWGPKRILSLHFCEEKEAFFCFLDITRRASCQGLVSRTGQIVLWSIDHTQ
jgi:hypothetical protein